jgi:hypothetical protein
MPQKAAGKSSSIFHDDARLYRRDGRDSAVVYIEPSAVCVRWRTSLQNGSRLPSWFPFASP